MKPLRLKQAAISPVNPTYHQQTFESVGVGFGTVGFEIRQGVPPDSRESVGVSFGTVGFQLGTAIPPRSDEQIGVTFGTVGFDFKPHPYIAHDEQPIGVSFGTVAFEYKTHPNAVSSENIGIGFGTVGFEFAGQSAGLGWDPTLLKSAPWLLYDDKSVIVESAGKISQWGDRSGNGWHMSQSTSTAQPSMVSNALYGRRIVRFDGGDVMRASAAGTVLRNVANGWIFAVTKKASINGAASTKAVFVIPTNQSGYSRLALYDKTQTGPNRHTVVPYARRLDSDSVVGLDSATDTGSNWVMTLATTDYQGRTLRLYANGELSVENLTAFAAAGASSNTNSVDVTIGGDAGGNDLWDGDMACALMGRGIPTLSEIDKLFGYYANRYGLQSLLVSNHPYKALTPYPPLTSSKLLFEGDDNSAVFTDVSGKVWTRTGSCVISTAQTYNGTSSYYNPSGTTGSISTPYHEDFDLSTEDFCIQAFCRPTGTSSGSVYGTIVSKRNTGADFDWVLFQNQYDRSVTFSYGDGSAARRNLSSAANSLPADTWTHVAVSRYRSTLRLWINGVLANTHTIVGDVLNRSLPVEIGKSKTYADSYWAGWLDGVEITKGEAVYYNAFVPPTLPPPSVGAGNDPYWDNVISLLRFNGSVADDKGLTWTPQAGASVIDTDSKFGTGCLDLKRANGSRLVTPYNSAFDFGTQSFTIEGFVKLKPGGWGGFICHRLYSTYGWAFACYSDRSIAFRANIGGVWSDNYGRSAAGVLLTDTWHHVALCRDGSNWRLFVDGVIVGTFTNAGALYNASTSIRYGVSQIDGTVEWPLDGKLDEWRITKGVARYTSNFSPPVEPFPNPPTNVVMSNLKFEGPNNSTTFTDEKGIVWTPGTGAVLSTDAAYSGSSSGYFNGSSAQLTTPTTAAFDFSQDFIVEMDVYPLSVSSQALFSVDGAAGVHIGHGISITSSGFFACAGQRAGIWQNYTSVIGTTPVTVGQWYRLRMVKVGLLMKLYVNGVEKASVTLPDNFIAPAGRTTYLGRYYNGTEGFHGYIDNFVFKKGT